MIAYWFPPLKSVSLRSYFAYQEFKKYFTAVQVITTDNSKVMPQEHLPMDAENLHKVFTLDYRTLFQKKNNEPVNARKRSNKWMAGFIKMIDSFPFNLIVGEGGIFYLVAGFLKARKLIRKQKITHIYSTFRPYTDHGIAYLLKRCYPNLIWIADFRDLHVDYYLNNVYATNFRHWCNKKILQKADVLTTVSNGLAIHLRAYHPHIYVLKNGFTKLPVFSKTPSTFDKEEVFKIVYTGALYNGKRNPLILLKAVDHLVQKNQIDSEKIEIIYAGKDGQVWDKWLSETNTKQLFRDLGVLPRATCLNLQQNAQLNLLLTYANTQMTGYLTGKFYEYLEAGKPLLNIINGAADDEFEDIFKELNPGMLVYNQEKYISMISHFLLQLYHEWTTQGTVTTHLNKEKLVDYQWEHTIPAFLAYLDEIRPMSAK